MFNNILFVCIGNICRSPMGEAILKHRAQQIGWTGKIHSAGIAALVEQAAHPLTLAVLSDNQIPMSPHSARQITAAILAEADLVLVMEQGHRRELSRLFPSACGKVHLLGKWGHFEISDPYRKPQSAFEQTFNLISRGLDEWQKQLWA